MPQRGHLVTVRDPRASTWQSIVEKVAKKKRAMVAPRSTAASLTGAQSQELNKLESFVDACHAQVFERAEANQGRIPPALAAAPVTAGGPPAPGVLEKTKRCSALAAQLAWAKVFGPAERLAALQNAFDFNVCDPFWADCVKEYESYFKLHGKTIPYRAGLDNVLPWKLPANARIAIFGDWGTGTADAVDLLQQIKGFQPDALLHLGDVYYSGTLDEMQDRFQAVVASVFGVSPPRRFSLSGNHDMYSGGAGYYWLTDQLEQGASYFAVQNDDWLFIGMDTGKHDSNPLDVSSNNTMLEQTEADWINGLVAASQNQKVVLFSHHPLFSAYEPIAGGGVNQVLLSQLSASLDKVTAWFWGHEHRLGVYDAFQGIRRGRCLGHAAVPVFSDATGDPPKLAGVPVLLVNGAPLDPGSANGLFKHGFAIMELAGKNATVSYYRQGEAAPLWKEAF
jgi:hypothetical protein